MPIASTDALVAVLSQYQGGSEGRYRHRLNRRFIYSDGVKAMAEAAQAYWLVDLMALAVAPVYARAWKKGEVGTGIVTLAVQPKSGGSGQDGVLTLMLADNKPAAFTQSVRGVDYPLGEWSFYFGTDEIAADEYVTTVCLPQEY